MIQICIQLSPYKRGLVILNKMLVLVKCYDNKMVKAPHLFHPFVDSALGSWPKKKKSVQVTYFYWLIYKK